MFGEAIDFWRQAAALPGDQRIPSAALLPLRLTASPLRLLLMDFWRP